MKIAMRLPSRALSHTLIAASAFVASAAAQTDVSTVWRLDSPTGGTWASFAIDPSGGIVALDYDTGVSQQFVVSIDSLGRTEWTTLIGSGGGTFVYRVATGDAGQIWATGYISENDPAVGSPLGLRDGFLARLDPTGQIVWQRRLGGAESDRVRAVTDDGAGGVIVVGSTESPMFGGVGVAETTGFVASYDGNGNEVWVTRFDVPGGPTNRLDLDAVTVTPAGLIVVGGKHTYSVGSDTQQYRAVVDGTGVILGHQFGSDGGVNALHALPSGQILSAGNGYTAALRTGFACMGPPTGGGVCVTQFGGPFVGHNSFTYDVTADGSGGMLAACLDSSPIHMGQPVFRGLIQYDMAGQELQRYGLRLAPCQVALPRRVASDGQGSYYALIQIYDDCISATYPSFRLVRLGSLDPFAATTCVGVANSTQRPATLNAVGTPVRSEDSIALFAVDLPATATTLFLASRAQGFAVGPGGSQGDLCLGGSVGRFVGAGEVATSSLGGRAALELNLGALPSPLGPVGAVAGETWYFQAWYRDMNPTPSSNFTSAVGILLQ